MTYIDGFVIPVPAGKKDAYREMAAKAAAVFQEFGALEVVETWGDDVPHGKITDFYRAVGAEEGENVVFSWIVWPSKEVRDEGNKKVMADPRMQPTGDRPPSRPHRAWSAGTSSIRASARRPPLPFIPASSAGRRSISWIWARWANTASSAPTASRWAA
jgi:uncharacterized protein YbaA (DUF1428 family)